MNPSVAADGPLKRGDYILDKYEVRGLLGKGGHAFVYDCFNAFLAEEVAIKLIPIPDHRGHQLLKRARGEAQVLYRLNHPNVVRVMDGGEFDGMVYIVMEKLDGISLRQMLRQRRSLPVVDALLIALQVAEALEAAHAMNVIHRDLKPDNIFLLAGNHVKVLDFGIAKFLDGYQTTQRDLIQGTAPYMSPEQAQGLGVTFASDIFQLGTMLYEMIAGVCPCMVGVEEVTLQQLVVFQIAKLPPRLKLLVHGVPDYVDRLVWRAIAKQAMQRFATMTEFTDAIRSALERLGVDLTRERLHRAATALRSSSRAPALNPSPDSGVVKTSAFALATPKIASHLHAPPDARTEPMPPGPPPSVPPRIRGNVGPDPNASDAGKAAKPRSQLVRTGTVRAADTDPSARVILIRAMLIGAVAAVPVGLVFGLAQRRHAARVAATVERATPPAAASAVSTPPPLSVNSSSPPALPQVGTAIPSSAVSHSTTRSTSPSSFGSTSHSTGSVGKTKPKSSRGVTTRPASGLDDDAPGASASASALARPSVVPTVTAPTRAIPKPIF
jgi:eukaryotic-like serine/threonine-protein kinase